MTRQLLIAIIALSFITAYSQTGGNGIYNFLDLTNSARAAALGGQQISIYDDDLNFVYQNPSLLNASMSNQLALNYIPYLAKINYGYVSYARTFEKTGNFAAGIHYINYGQFIGADEFGNKNGNFWANEYSINVSYSKPILDSLFNIGIAYKVIYSQMEVYNSLGMAIDAGITYNSNDKLFTTALVVKNLGVQIFTYSGDGNREPLSFEIQYGVSQKLRHAPFRISLLVQHIETPNLRYTSELDIANETDPYTGEIKAQNKLGNFADNVMRHMIFGLEFLPSKYFCLRFGYNYKRRQELKIADKTAFVGFSWGLGLNISKYHFSYGRASYHLAAASNTISLSVNLNDFKKKF
jgi:hypothetical protein